MEAWIGAFEDFEIEIEDISDMGNGVVLSLPCQSGRPHGVSGAVSDASHRRDPMERREDCAHDLLHGHR
jgi:hypothetical protein